MPTVALQTAVHLIDALSPQEWAERVVEYACDAFAESQGIDTMVLSLSPHPEKPTRKIVHIVDPTSSGYPMDEVLEAMPTWLRHIEAEAYIKVSEAWRVSTEDGQETPEPGTLENHPDREDIVMVLFESEFDSWLKIFPVKNEDGRRVLGEGEHFPEPSGRFTGWLKSTVLH